MLKIIASIFFNLSRENFRLMYVLSAVRTPIGLLKGSLNEFSVGDLSAIIIKEALERAVVSPDDIENVFMGCALNSNFGGEVIKRTGISKSTKFKMSNCSLESFVSGCQFMAEYNKKVCLIGGVESMSNNFPFKNSVENVFKMQSKSYTAHIKPHNSKNYIPYDELAKIIFRKKGQQIIVTEDEGIDKFQKIESGSNNLSVLWPGDGAVAGVIANKDYVNQNFLTPLAEILSYARLPSDVGDYTSLTQIIKKALDKAGFDSQCISMWAINSLNQETVSSCIRQFNINPLLISETEIFNHGYPLGMYGGKIITNMIHSLSFNEFGCASGITLDGISSAVVFKKLCSNTSRQPQLVLYTKKQCSLCEDLEKDLEPYKDRFSLRKIDIEDNEKLRKLFEYEIPVLFLDGLFLCKHRLNLDHFNHCLLRSEHICLDNQKKD